MKSNYQIRREILMQLQPRVRHLCPHRMTREEFLKRHHKFDRFDAFVLGLFAGAALLVIVYLVCTIATK